MLLFNVFLYLSVLTEYSAAWFVAAAGVYAILRLWKQHATGRLLLLWALGQLVAVGLYLFSYKFHISRWQHKGAFEGIYTTWLQSGFPDPHENSLRFAVHGTLEQFKYMFQMRTLAWAAAVLFLLGLYFLWRRKSPFYAIMMVSPFCFAYSAAVFHLYPYGPSRHTAILHIAIAATVGTAVATLARHRLLPIMAAAPACVIAWILLVAYGHGIPDEMTIPPAWHRLKDMRGATASLQKSVPPNALIAIENFPDLTLGYYWTALTLVIGITPAIPEFTRAEICKL